MLTYNQADYLIECLESIKKVVPQNSKIIILDDGSSDETALKVSEFMRSMPSTVYIQQANTGQIAVNTLRLIRESTAEFALLMSGDDKLDSNYPLLQLTEILSAEPMLDFAIPNYAFMSDENRNKQYQGSLRRALESGSPHLVLSGHLNRKVSRIFLQGSIFRRSFLESLELNGSPELLDDYELVFQLFKKLDAQQKRFKFADHALWLYRLHEQNLHKSQLRQFALVSQTVDRHLSSIQKIKFRWDLPKLQNIQEVIATWQIVRSHHSKPIAILLMAEVVSFNVFFLAQDLIKRKK